MITGYFHIGCHFKVKNLQGQSHHLSWTGFPDTLSRSEPASGPLHNKDLGPWHCLRLDLYWESFKAGFTATIAAMLYRGRICKRKQLFMHIRKFELLWPYIEASEINPRRHLLLVCFCDPWMKSYWALFLFLTAFESFLKI